jgi:hypothetical protein
MSAAELFLMSEPLHFQPEPQSPSVVAEKGT